MKKITVLFILLLGIFFFLPCVLVVIAQKNVTCLWKETESIERYIPGILYETTEREMHTEMLKAQAILIRSNLIFALEQKTISYEDLKQESSLIDKGRTEEDQAFYERLVEIGKETEGQVVTYDSEVCYCPFFYSSNGTTREAFSFFEDGSYPYLIAVPSHRDEESDSYVTYHHFSIEEFYQKMNELSGNFFGNRIEILERDESDYITWLKVGETVIGGEIFREKLGLSSACFTIEQKDNGIRVTCRGRGHGFGFSQYGANAMAIDGKGYKELIEYYFHNIAIENVYRFS